MKLGCGTLPNMSEETAKRDADSAEQTAYVPTAPREIDLNALSLQQKNALERQDRFLKHYVAQGTIQRAADLTGIHRRTQHEWTARDTLGFNERFQLAKDAFRERLENLLFQRVWDPTGNRGSDVLAIFLMKAHWRDKYGDISVLPDDAAKDTLASLRKLSKDAKKREKSGESETEGDAAVAEVDRMLDGLKGKGRAERN